MVGGLTGARPVFGLRFKGARLLDRILNQTKRVCGEAMVFLKLLVTLNFATFRRLMRVNSLFDKKLIVQNFSNMREMFFHVDINIAPEPPSPLAISPQAIPDSFIFRQKTFDTRDWIDARSLTAMVVLKDTKLVHEAYFRGTTPQDLRISWSVAKSLLSAAIGVAVAEKKIANLDAQVIDLVPSLKKTAYDGVTIKNLLQMASGVYFNEDYLDYNSDINKMGRVLALGGSMDEFAASLKNRGWEPGSRNHYVSIDTHVLGMILRAATGQPAHEYVAEKILGPLKLEANPYYLTDGLGVAFVLGGINMCTRDYARFGLMFAQNGLFEGRQIVAKNWVKTSTVASAPPPIEELDGTDDGALGYGYQWWLAPKPRAGEFFAHGIYGQFIYVNQSQNVVIATNAADLDFTEGDGRVTLEHIAFFREIADQIT